jgi:hypothetical protein
LTQAHVTSEDAMGTPSSKTPAPAGALDASDAAGAPATASAGKSPSNSVSSGPRPWLRGLGDALGLKRRAVPEATAAPAAAPVAVAAPEPLPEVPASPLDALYALAPRLRTLWAADTSAAPAQWSPGNPARGQSAVTACIVHDAMGGSIVESVMLTPTGATVSHFCNDVGGLTIDLTPTEFPPGTTATDRLTQRPGFATMRDYVLSLPGVEVRYELLRNRLRDLAAAA